jgi:hypothetical protein
MSFLAPIRWMIGWLGLVAVAAAAEAPPTLSIDSSCTAAGKSGTPFGRTKNVCVASERAALAQLSLNWPRYSAHSKVQCLNIARRGASQSYVELITCLDINQQLETDKTGIDDTGPADIFRQTPPGSSGVPRRRR